MVTTRLVTSLQRPDALSVTGLEKAQAIRNRKNGTRLATLTAYDYPTARLLDEAGIDLLLVGDSLGMVVLGYPDTTHVTMEHMLHHTAAVARAKTKAIVVADLPINSYDNPAEALANAKRLIEAGADAVKLEGGIRQAGKVKAITAAGIPVCGHLGMLPQRVLEEGGYHKKGKTPEQTAALFEGANTLIDAGVFAIVLESVVPDTARHLTEQLPVPTIGIGSGGETCDGEVAVVTDLLGTYPWFVPPFAQPEASLSTDITQAVRAYRTRVQSS
jgi:3-methyl-2-oxobutanoate hydroxymethyltransferase